MIQREVKEVLDTLGSRAMIRLELNQILSRYLFECNSSYVRESIQNDVERLLKDKFENGELPCSVQIKYARKGKIPTNITINYHSDDSSLVLCPNDDETLEFFKDLELL